MTSVVVTEGLAKAAGIYFRDTDADRLLLARRLRVTANVLDRGGK